MSHPSQPSYVIALSGPSGAGKSTLARALSLRLDTAVTLGIDDYEATSSYPDTTQWLAEGADPNLFQTPQFVADLQALRSGQEALLPDSSAPINPTRFIIIEEPFGRGRAAMSSLIDFVVYLDIPLEIALARKILRKNAFLPWEQNPDLFISHLRQMLGWYMDTGRDFYLAVLAHARKGCDLAVDGTRPTDELADAIVRVVQAKQNPS